MAAPMRRFMLFDVKVSSPTKTCFHPVICKSLSRFLGTSPLFNRARGFRGSPIQPEARSMDFKIQPNDTNDSDIGTYGSQHFHDHSIDTEPLNDHNSRGITTKDPEDKINNRAGVDISKVKYEKADAGDKRIGRLMMLVKSRKYREQTGRVMLEGRRLITDAIESGLQAHTIFFSRLDTLKDIPIHKTRASLIKVPFKDITIWSDVVTTQGVIGVFKKPTHELVIQSKSTILPLTLICDNIREPGNLGTILRSGVAAQCEKILLTKGCVDLWEPKVLRSGAGAHFRMPITANIPWKSIPNYLDDDNIPVHVADNHISRAESPRVDSSEMSYPGKQDCDEGYPIQEQIQGLRHINQDLIDKRSMLESKIYFEIDWRVKSALVIGGETEGLSDDALDLSDRSLGFRVHIPMAQTMDSLNSAVSASVILFEVLRQNAVDGRI